MKTTFLLIASFFCISSFGQDLKVHRGKKRIYIYDSTNSYGSIRIKKDWSSYSHFEVSGNIGYSINSNSRNSNEWFKGGDGRAFNLNAGFYTSETFTIGIDYSNIEWRDKDRSKYSSYADPAHIISLRLQKQILFNNSELPINLKVGYTTFKDGTMNGVNRNFSGSGLNFGIGIGYRRNLNKLLFVGISANAGWSFINGETVTMLGTRTYTYTRNIEVHYHYALFEIGLRI